MNLSIVGSEIFILTATDSDLNMSVQGSQKVSFYVLPEKKVRDTTGSPLSSDGGRDWMLTSLIYLTNLLKPPPQHQHPQLKS